MVASNPMTLTKGIVYFTDNILRPDIAEACQRQLLRAINGHYLLSVSLKPLDFGDNIVVGLERGVLTMFKQILMGVSNVQEDICFLAEHDVAYHPSHFDFVPPCDNTFYYNQNVWQVSAETGEALFWRRRSVSQLCAHTQLLIDHYGDRVKQIEEGGLSTMGQFLRMGFEPGTKRISHGGVDDRRHDVWFADHPNVDIKGHGTNLTRALWRRDEFRNQKYTAGWTAASEVPGWGQTQDRFPEFLKDVAEGRIPVVD